MRKKWYTALMLALAAFVLCGCNMRTMQDLYCPPIRSEQYTNLQSVMRQAMAGFDYSAPLNGENQQTVQTADLNGDGEDEYILFAKGSSEKPLQIFVFAGDGETYQLIDTIESTGTAFDQVEYIQMDDEPGYEIVVGRQVSDQVVRSVSVYSMADGQMQQLLAANYSEFIVCDLDSNGRSDLFVLEPGNGAKGVAALYSMVNGSMERSEEVNMSESADNIKRIMVSKLHGGTPAVYVASAVTGSSGIITDVYAIVAGQMRNVSLSNESGTSVQTLRNYYVYADDIDHDGVLELPSLITTKISADNAENSNQYVIRWYSMTTEGSEVTKMYTYHNFTGGWYIQLDGTVAERVTVTHKGSNYEFFLWNEEFTESVTLMRIYALTGQKREEQAVIDNRFVLYRGETTVYAANLGVAYAEIGMTKESLIHCFDLVHEDWKKGET